MGFILNLKGNNTFDDVIELNNSKSVKIRHLILEFIFFNRLINVSENDPEDVKIVYSQLAVIQKGKEKKTALTTVNVENCGAAYRYLLAVLAITEGKWLLTGSERLLQRPIDELVNSLLAIGASIEKHENDLFITGKSLHAETIRVNSSESSQFVTAILLISNCVGLRKLEIEKGLTTSLPYILMTCKILREYGIATIFKENNITIAHPPSISSPPIEIESDWSAAVFWYALAALSQNVRFELTGLKLNSSQGDSVIRKWFEKFGVFTTETAKGIVIAKTDTFNPKEISFDLTNTPDLAPVLATMGALLPVKLTLTGLQTLNTKESKRLDVLVEELSKIAFVYSEDNEKVVVDGTLRIQPSTVPISFNTHQDHRFIMAFSLISLYYEIRLPEIKSVKKSYPGFIKHFMQIGGKIAEK